MKTAFFVSTSISAALIALLSAPAAYADEAGPLDEVVVTANRTPEPLNHVGGQITVIDQAEIRRQQTLVVSDILNRVPGVNVSRNGGPGAATQVRIRGAEEAQTLVVIDGVKLNDPTAPSAGYNFGELLLGDIDHIEVLRGAQSVLWGSQAIGGVVNIITRQPEQPFEVDGAVEAGSMKTADGRLGLGGKTDRVSWRLAGAYFTTDGVSDFDKAKGGRELDGYQNIGASGSATVRLTDQLSLDLRGVFTRGHLQIDGFNTPTFSFGDDAEYSINRDMVAYAGLNLSLLDGRFLNRAAVGYTDTRHHNYDPLQAVTTTTFDAAGRNRRFEYQGTLKATDTVTAVFGAEAEHSTLRSVSPSSFAPNPPRIRRSADLSGVYAQVSAQPMPTLTLTGGVRYDHHDTFGGHVVGQASAAWTVAPGTVLRGSWGQGFKAPSLYQLGSEYGNTALKPEHADSWDVGVQQVLANDRLTVSAAYFQRHSRNMIDFFSCTSAATARLCTGPNGAFRFGYYDNIIRTKADGIELDAQAQVTDALSLNANYSWVKSVNDTSGSANYRKRLARRPRHEANADATYVWPVKLTTSVAARYSGKSFDDVANRTELKGYVLWDIRASYPVTDQIEVYGRIENLFDRSYETIFRYGQLGRAAYAGVRARF